MSQDSQNLFQELALTDHLSVNQVTKILFQFLHQWQDVKIFLWPHSASLSENYSFPPTTTLAAAPRPRTPSTHCRL